MTTTPKTTTMKLMKSDEIRKRYWSVSDRLCDARLKDSARVELLTYAAEMLAAEYRAAKAKEPGAIRQAFDEMFDATVG